MIDNKKLCEVMFDITFNVSSRIAELFQKSDIDSRNVFNIIYEKAKLFEDNFQDDGSYLEMVDALSEEVWNEIKEELS